MKKYISSSILFLSLTGAAFASHPETMLPVATTPGKIYVGVFGGGGSSNQFHVSQYGTAFYTEAVGGPLAVDAFGHTNSRSGGFYGLQVGYQAPAILLNNSSSLWNQWALAPAVEIEGFNFSKRTYTADIVNETPRLEAHEFVNTYPMERSVFLANAVFSLNNPCYLFHPYVGIGIGGAIVKISGAEGTQVEFAEPGVNHYNSNTSDTSSTFAGQFKLGLSYDINQYINVFAEYRWLYLSSTQFEFGSTVYPDIGHVETTNWTVKMDAQKNNLGTIGIRFSV